jgi:hypothetical protein
MTRITFLLGALTSVALAAACGHAPARTETPGLTRTPEPSGTPAQTNLPAPEKMREDAERERYVDACLEDSASIEGENQSQLWDDLAKFAFALPDDETGPDSAEAVLDRAATRMAGLDSEAGWASAGRYFQAENFHSFERPACARAYALRQR